MDMFAGWTATPVQAAATRHNPNPVLKTPAWLKPPAPSTHPDLGQYIPAAKPVSQQPALPHVWVVSMKPATLMLTNAPAHFVSSDQQLSVDVPAGSLAVQQPAPVQHALATGGISLSISQVKPAAGGLRSEHIFFGTYAFQFFDRLGHPLAGVRLRVPLTIQFHLTPAQRKMVWQGQQLYTLWSQVVGNSAPPTMAQARTLGHQVLPTAMELKAATAQTPLLIYATSDGSGQNWSLESTFTPTPPVKGTTISATGIAAVQASTITFGIQAPQATWGTPSDFQVGLNSGGLTYSYPVSIPPGPGGLLPSLAFNYSSGSVNENHNVQATAPWVGQGWSLDLGSISWAQENVTPNPGDSNPNHIESVWHISTPDGIGGQLIPPDLRYRTSDTLNPTLSQLNSGVYIWHTAPESHAKGQEIAFGSYPCWQVWLPNGVMEEFGCTDDSRQAYVDSLGNWVMNKWQPDLLIDRYGNQVHISYQKHTVNNAVLDSAMTDITYDDPSCHNTTAACSSWHPQIDIHFDAGQTVTRLVGGNCGNWTPPNANVRCDDPADDSSSGGLPAPKVMGAYVLNDVQVKVNGSILREYDLSYNQGGSSAYTDPTTGQTESIAGFLTLASIATKGTGGTASNAPTITMQYTGFAEHYSDLFSDATPSTNCSPYGGAPHDGSGCYLWAMTYHQYYLSNLDNGEGWHETITWEEAHANTWGLDAAGAVNDALACTGGQSATNNCGRADDKNWSWMVVKSRTATTNGVSSTWSCNYYLQTDMLGASIPGYSALSCTSVCRQTYTWGSQNDNDYADYYNGDFQSFRNVQVLLPDGSSQVHTYGATTGWGLANSSITCYVPFPSGKTCSVASYTVSTSQGLATVFAGKEQHEEDYQSTSGLMRQIKWAWGANCSPLGVAGSVGAAGGSIDPGPSYLFSELDEGNPVIVCDPRVAVQDTYLTDNVTGDTTDPRVVHTTVSTTYDGNNQGVNAYDYGNVDTVDTTGNDVGGQHIIQQTRYFPNDNVGNNVYLTDLPAFSSISDGTTYWHCQAWVYTPNGSAPHAPTQPEATQQLGYLDPHAGCAGTLISTQHSYDSSGNPITGTDPDGHLGCHSGSSQYSACASYDSFDTHLTTASNAKNQITTYHYDSSASGGYGQWLMSTTDANGQTTSYTYDVLGRLTRVIRPGDSVSQPTISYTYTNTCSVGTTSPCLRLDTTTRETSGSQYTSTTSQWFDGMGRLVETQSPGIDHLSQTNQPSYSTSIVTYTIYDQMGRATTQSLPYAINVAYAGSFPGGIVASYVAPDLTQARTVTSYDSLGRSLGSVTYNNTSQIISESTISYTVGQGMNDFAADTSTPFEQKTVVDAYNHRTITYTDALGRDRYEEVDGDMYGNGVDLPPPVISGPLRLVQYNWDTAGNVTSIVTYGGHVVSSGSITTIQLQAMAHTTAIYDGLKRRIGYDDSDLGSCQSTPMPTSCSSSSDTAWSYTYDADGNLLSQTDPRNITTYSSYDLLDRPLCRGTASSQVNPCGSGAYDAFFYDSYDNSSNSGIAFPTGCTTPAGTSTPVGKKVAEIFSSAAGSGWRCAGYDARGQTIASALSITSDGQTTTQNVSMTYDDLGAITSLIYPDGETVTSNYDAKGRFFSAYFGTPASSDPVPFLSSRAYYTDDGLLSGFLVGGTGNRISGNPTAPLPSLFGMTLGYDGVHRLVSSSATRSSTVPFWSQQRTYDNVGNVLQLSTTLPTTSGGSLTDNQSFCYDALNRLTWAGNSAPSSSGPGALLPLGGPGAHCGATPTGSTTTAYVQGFGYDPIDRMTFGSAGSQSYADASHVHAATSLSTIPNPYASYDAMGNMTCRNVDTTGSQSCASGAQTGATMSYDNEGRLASWTAPSGIVESDQFLYDNEGNRVLQRNSNTATGSTTPTITDTITFDSYSEVSISAGVTTPTIFFSAAGQRVAMRKGAILSYLIPDFLGSSSVALNNDGSIQAVQLFSPYGAVRYSDQVMPTDYSFTGQRLDSVTGLLYYNARYYDPVSGRFTSADLVQNNTSGMDPFAYVGDNPESRIDPTGRDACDATCISTVVSTAGVAGIELGPADLAVMGITLASVLIWDAYSSSQQSATAGTVANTAASSSIGIDIGIANKPGAWKPTEREVVAGKVKAWGEEQRADKIAATGGVALDEKEDPAKANPAAAFLAITDTSGVTTTYVEFALGFRGADKADHAEAQLIALAIKTITEQSSTRALTNVNLLIWSGKTPCKQYCNQLLYSHTWLKALWQAMGNPQGTGWANLDFYAGGIPGTPFAERYSYSYNGLNIVQRDRLRDL